MNYELFVGFHIAECKFISVYQLEVERIDRQNIAHEKIFGLEIFWIFSNFFLVTRFFYFLPYQKFSFRKSCKNELKNLFGAM